jgi:integrase/recombinase XerD
MNEKERRRIYGETGEEIYLRELLMLEKESISKRNKELIRLFHNSLSSKGCKGLRIAKLSSQLRRICIELNSDLDKIVKQDIEKLFAFYNKREDYSNATKNDYKRCIKQFYHWFEDEDERIYGGSSESRERIKRFYKSVFSLKLTSDVKERDAGDVISDEDIDKVILNGTNSFKDKSFLKLLHETGMRCSEILSLKIKDLKFKKSVATVNIPGTKTEERKIPIIHSLPYLRKYLEIHPDSKNEDSFLFIGESRRHGMNPLMRNGAQKLINRCFETVGIDKKHNLHWFRHSRASLLAPNLTEVLLCKFMGWVIGSKQVKRYVHLGNVELESVYCRMSGIEIEGKKNKNKELKKCVCGTLNENSSNYCYICGQALNLSILLKEESKSLLEREEEYDEELNKSIQLLMEFVKNPGLMKKFEEFKIINKSRGGIKQ